MRPVTAIALSLASLVVSATGLADCALLSHCGPAASHLFVVNTQPLLPHGITYLPKRSKIYVCMTGEAKVLVLERT